MKTGSGKSVLSPLTERRYASFVIRCWTLGGGGQRIKVEHIQTGERTLVVTLTDAAGWMEARSSCLSNKGEEEG